MDIITFHAGDAAHQGEKQQYITLRDRVYRERFNSGYYTAPSAGDADPNTVFTVGIENGKVIADGRLLIKSSPEAQLFTFEDSPEHRIHQRFPTLPADARIGEISAVVTDPAKALPFSLNGEKITATLREPAKSEGCDIILVTTAHRNASAMPGYLESEKKIHARAFPGMEIAHDGNPTLLIMNSLNDRFHAIIDQLPDAVDAAHCPRPTLPRRPKGRG